LHNQTNIFYEYFYNYLTELDEEQRKLISAIRTKTGLVILCDRLKAIEVEKQVVMRVYEELKVLF